MSMRRLRSDRRLKGLDQSLGRRNRKRIVDVDALIASAAFDLDPETLRGTVANGAAVSAITDRKGMTLAGATNQPTYMTAATPNGKAALNFLSASSHRLTSSGDHSAVDNMFAGQGSFILMATKAVTTGGGGFGRVFNKGSTGTPDRFGIAGLVGGIPAGALGAAFSTTNPSMQLDETLPLNAWHVVGIHYSADNPNVFEYVLNDGPYKAKAPGTLPAGNYVDNVADALILGNNPAFTRGWNGQVARMIIIRKKPTKAEMLAAVAWLRTTIGAA